MLQEKWGESVDLKTTAAKLTGDPERDIKQLSNHVFQLEEQLRYQLRNLDVTNFNDLGLARYENGRLQVYAKQVEVQTEKLRLEFGKETDELYAEISATAEELLAEIEDLDGKYASISVTVDGLTTRVGNTEGNYSSLSQTVSGIQTTVKGHTTTINSHTNSINSQNTKISSLESSIKQTADKIEAVVSAVDDSNGNVTAASIVLAINNAGSGVKISADHVNISGLVTFTDLSTEGSTTINAGNITTGSISADRISGGTLSGVTLESTGWYTYETITISDGAISVGNTSAMIGSNAMGSGYFAADTMVLIEGGSEAYLQCGWNYCVVTQNGAKLSYDSDTYRIWVDGNGCWSNKSMAVYSDRRMKSEISYDMGAYEAVFNGLRPCTFLYNGEKDGKRHMGFVAQEFVQAATDSGLTENDFAMIASDGEYFGIAYGEMTALNTHMIQRLMERVNKLEERL